MNSMNTKNSASDTARLAVIVGSYLMILLDTSVVITGLPHIRDDIGLSPIELFWVQSIYTLMFGGFLLLGARAGDILGGRRALNLGLSIFMATSLAIAFAQTPAWLLTARAAQGIGAAIVAPSALTLLSNNFEEGEKRSWAVAWYGSAAGIGASIGLVAGGLFADLLSWRVGFLVNLPVGLLLIFAAKRYLRDSGRAPVRLDLVGAILSTFGVGAIIYAVTQAAEAGWGDLQTMALLSVGALLSAIFIWHESRVEQPLMPLRLFADRRRVGAYIARFLFLGPMVGFFFFGSQFLQGELGFTATEAGLGFLPMTIFAFVAALHVPWLSRSLGEGAVLVGGLLTIFVGMVWLSFAGASADFWISVAMPMVLIGAGQGLALAPMTSAGISGAAQSDTGAASGIVNVAHQLGASFGLGLLSSIGAMAVETGTVDRDAILAQTHAVFQAGSAMLLLAAALSALLVLKGRSPTRCLCVAGQ